MADDNYNNIIKPVEGLQNIIGLTPAKRREERKRRRDLRSGNRQKSGEDPGRGVDEKSAGVERAEDGTNEPSNDYCA